VHRKAKMICYQRLGLEYWKTYHISMAKSATIRQIRHRDMVFLGIPVLPPENQFYHTIRKIQFRKPNTIYMFVNL